MGKFSDDIEIEFEVRSVSKHERGPLVVQITMDFRFPLCTLVETRSRDIRQVFIKFGLEGLEDINTNAAAIFVLTVDSVNVVTRNLNFRESVTEPSSQDSEMVKMSNLFVKIVSFTRT